ncbi:MAG: hypothetical protein ACLFQU_04675 [Candidatus Kapaibacterium sp.]
MKRLPEYKLTRLQLYSMMNAEQKSFVDYILENNIICAHCKEPGSMGMNADEYLLTDMNDLLVKGTCKKCNGEVGRLMEFGEDQEFYNKAMKLRREN